MEEIRQNFSNFRLSDLKKKLCTCLKVALGQYAGVGPIQIFGRLAPVAGGLGLSVVGVSVFLGEVHYIEVILYI